MRHWILGSILLASLAGAIAVGQAPVKPGLIPGVRAAIAKQDFSGGEALVEQYRSTQGTTSTSMQPTRRTKPKPCRRR
jgi:hypothetical protein